MDKRYELFCLADRFFYDSPSSTKAASQGFPAADRPLPSGWARSSYGDWLVRLPPGGQIPAQGWKIHVSATHDNAEAILGTIFDYCVPRNIPFKFLASPLAFHMRNAKYAPRSASGKFVTIYPADEEACERILAELDNLVGGAPGPYILSDLRYAGGPLSLSLALFCSLMPSMARRQRRSMADEEAVAGSVSQALAGLRDVIACGAEDQVRTDIMDRVAEQAAALRAVARMNMLRTLCLAVGGWLPLVLVLAATPSLARHGVGPAAMVGAVTYIGGALKGALSSVTRGLGGTSIRLSITLQRIAEASGSSLDPGTRESTQSGEQPGLGPAAGGTGQVSLRNVTFAYGPYAEAVLRDLCLDIPSGDHVAIVGPSGIGKSTLAGLAAGLLHPRAGEVWLDGMPMSALPLVELPRHRVLIPQEAYVFDGTLGENLRYLVPGVAEADLDTSVDAVGLRAVVTRAGGYAGNVIPAALSAGERQLIALARAHLSPARIVILDEATCHLDPDAAARAEDAFAARPGTLIVIAHRISSALRARRVLVLDGTRAEIGDHATLLARSPMYRDLVGHWQEAHDQVADGPAAGEGELAIRW